MYQCNPLRRLGAPAASLVAAAALAAEPVVTPPQLITPQGDFADCYPIGSVMRGREARVIAGVTVLPDGSVGQVRLPEGTPAWVRSATHCMTGRLRFTPGQIDGRPVQAEATLPVNLGIRGGDGSAAPALDTPVLRTAPADLETAYQTCYPVGLAAETTITYRFFVGVDGRVSGPKALDAEGDARLVKAGACVLKKLNFRPTLRGSQAIRSTITLPLLVRPPLAP